MIIRPVNPSDFEHLPAIERAAAKAFAAAGVSLPDPSAVITPDEWRTISADGMLLIAADDRDRPIGMLGARPIKDGWFIVEMDVHPDHQGRSIGRALIAAAKRKAERLYLTTFLTVPWNAPWYQRQGFRVMADAELSPELRQHVQQEAEAGLTDRCAMTWPE